MGSGSEASMRHVAAVPQSILLRAGEGIEQVATSPLGGQSVAGEELSQLFGCNHVSQSVIEVYFVQLRRRRRDWWAFEHNGGDLRRLI